MLMSLRCGSPRIAAVSALIASEALRRSSDGLSRAKVANGVRLEQSVRLKVRSQYMAPLVRAGSIKRGCGRGFTPRAFDCRLSGHKAPPTASARAPRRAPRLIANSEHPTSNPSLEIEIPALTSGATIKQKARDFRRGPSFKLNRPRGPQPTRPACFGGNKLELRRRARRRRTPGGHGSS